MTTDQLIAIGAGIGLPMLGGIAAFGWRLSARLASIDTIISREMSHNGGASTKDYAKAGRDEATAAKDQATTAKHLAENLGVAVEKLTASQRDTDRQVRKVNETVTGMQAVQQLLVERVLPGPTPGSTTTTTTATTTTEGTTL